MESQPKQRLNRNHIILWFLYFDGPPEEITNALGLTPTRVKLKGQEYTGGTMAVKRLQKFSYCEY